MSVVSSRRPDTDQTPSPVDYTFPQYLRAIVATGLAANNPEKPPETEEDFSNLVGISSKYRSTGIFSQRELSAIGKTLYTGPDLRQTLSPLLGYGSERQLLGIMEALEALPAPQTLSHLKQVGKIKLDLEKTADDAVLALVLKRDSENQILQEVLFYDKEVEGMEIMARDRIRFNPLGERYMPAFVAEALLEQALLRQQARGIEVAYVQDGEEEGLEQAPLLKRNPFEIVFEIFQQTGGPEYETPLHYTVEFNMMLDGVVLPSRERLVAIMDAFYPSLNAYTEGMAGFMQQSFMINESEAMNQRAEEVTRSVEKKLMSATRFDINMPLTRYLIDSLGQREGEPFITPEEVQQVTRDRLNFLEAYKRAYQTPLDGTQRLARYSLNQLVRDVHFLVGSKTALVAKTCGIDGGALMKFEEGKFSLAPDQARNVLKYFTLPEEGPAAKFVDQLLERYQSDYERYRGQPRPRKTPKK